MAHGRRKHGNSFRAGISRKTLSQSMPHSLPSVNPTHPFPPSVNPRQHFQSAKEKRKTVKRPKSSGSPCAHCAYLGVGDTYCAYLGLQRHIILSSTGTECWKLHFYNESVIGGVVLVPSFSGTPSGLPEYSSSVERLLSFYPISHL